ICCHGPRSSLPRVQPRLVGMRFHFVVIGPCLITSKSDPLMLRILARSSSGQRVSGAPEMYQFDPLSATIIPYFLSAVNITCTGAGYPETSTEALRRTRNPIGGSAGSV